MMKTAAGALLLLVVPGCVFYFEDDDPPFAGRDASVVFPTPDAWRQPDAEQEPTTACSPSLACPSAEPNKVTVCGRLYDVETDGQIRSVTTSFGTCGDGNTSGGACDLQLRFYDAIDFAGNPTAATPLPVEEFRLDDCGRFIARNINRPALGFLGIGVDDAAGLPDLRRLTGVAFPVTSQQVLTRTRAYSVRRTTDEAWTTQAGLVGSTFVDRGVIWKLFLDGNTPVAEVEMTGGNGQPRPADDFYFSDPTPMTRSTIDPLQTTTGANGSALMLNSGLVEHSGDGAERFSCEWTSDLAASIAGVLFYAPSHLQLNGGDCP